MAHTRFRFILPCVVLLLAVALTVSPRSVQARSTADWVNDGRLYVYLAFDGTPVTHATSDHPIQLNMTGPMHLELQVNNTGPKGLNMSASITFYYQGFGVLTVEIREPSTNKTFVIIPSNSSTPLSEAYMNLGQFLTSGGIQLATGLFEASLNFDYHEIGETPLYHVGTVFYLNAPVSPGSVLTSVAGIATAVATVGAVFGLGNNFYTLLDGLRTASKMRTIQKKAAEIRSLPNLTVLGALPLLFSIIKEMKTKGKGKDGSTEGVSGYIIKQRIRQVAPDAWNQDLCPICKSKWDRSLGRCKKCNIDTEEAKRKYAELLTTKVDPSVKLLGKKKALSVRRIAKKTKSSNYNAGVIGAAMVDTGVVEVTKIETPIRSFVMNLVGLGFLIVTWDQLLGFGSSQWQVTLTIMTAALSVGVIVALFFARRGQISKMRKALEAGRPLMPTEAERTSEAEVKEQGPQVSEPEEDKEDSP